MSDNLYDLTRYGERCWPKNQHRSECLFIYLWQVGDCLRCRGVVWRGPWIQSYIDNLDETSYNSCCIIFHSTSSFLRALPKFSFTFIKWTISTSIITIYNNNNYHLYLSMKRSVVEISFLTWSNSSPLRVIMDQWTTLYSIIFENTKSIPSRSC